MSGIWPFLIAAVICHIVSLLLTIPLFLLFTIPLEMLGVETYGLRITLLRAFIVGSASTFIAVSTLLLIPLHFSIATLLIPAAYGFWFNLSRVYVSRVAELQHLQSMQLATLGPTPMDDIDATMIEALRNATLQEWGMMIGSLVGYFAAAYFLLGASRA